MARDDVDVPPIMLKCCEAIEKYGLSFQGIYRVGGTISKVKDLREKLEKGLFSVMLGGLGVTDNPAADLDSVNLDAKEWSEDITVVTSVLKQWLRELPNPLLTYDLHDAFLDAART